MATYIAYDDVVLSQGAIAYWRLTDSESLPLPDATGNGHDITGLTNASFHDQPMFSYAPQSHGLLLENVNDSDLEITDQNLIHDAMNTAEAATVVVWMKNTTSMKLPGIVWGDGSDVAIGYGVSQTHLHHSDGETSYNDDFSGQNMLVVMADATRDYIWQDGVWLLDRARNSGVWPGLSDLLFRGYETDIAWLSVYDRVLTGEELDQQYKRRLFQGKIAGTMTLDGSPTADATVRSFRRSDGQINGETTSAADGTYEITVLDQVECDLLAIPPSGVAARPLAHGPILPDPYTQ